MINHEDAGRIRGMTLTEVLVSLLLVALSIGALLAGYQQASRLNQVAALRTRGFELAMAELEELKANPGAITGEDTWGTVDCGSGIVLGREIKFYQQSLNLYRVEIWFQWEVDGVRRTESLVTVMPGQP